MMIFLHSFLEEDLFISSKSEEELYTHLKTKKCFGVGHISEVDFNDENAQIVYERNGYDIDSKKVYEDIKAADPDIVFIATGQPSQEIFGNEISTNIPKAAVFCIGGSFDLFADKVSRAPKMMVKLNLEWLYRIYIQPHRAHRVFPALFNVIKVITGFSRK